MNKRGQMGLEHRVEITGLHAFAGDEAELFQGLSEKRSNVLLAIGDADARRDSSPAEFRNAEFRNLGRFFDSPAIHDALRI
jgi:hypothetical protein